MTWRLIYEPDKPHVHDVPDPGSYELGTIVQCECRTFLIYAWARKGPCGQLEETWNEMFESELESFRYLFPPEDELPSF